MQQLGGQIEASYSAVHRVGEMKFKEMADHGFLSLNKSATGKRRIWHPVSPNAFPLS